MCARAQQQWRAAAAAHARLRRLCVREALPSCQSKPSDDARDALVCLSSCENGFFDSQVQGVFTHALVVFHVLFWLFFPCPSGRPRAGACARVVRPGAHRPPTQATPCLRQSQVALGSPTASNLPALRLQTYVRIRSRYNKAHPPPGGGANALLLLFLVRQTCLPLWTSPNCKVWSVCDSNCGCRVVR